MTAVRAIGIDLQGGKGNANNFPDVAPTCMAISHGTPNAAMLYAMRHVPPFPRRMRQCRYTQLEMLSEQT